MSGNKEQQLTFGLGITNVPSDATCDDNTLEECVGLTYADGEHRVIQKPSAVFTLPSGHRLMYVHKFNGDPRYITKYNNALYWGSTNLGIPSPLSVESIGNTLIVNTSNGLAYLLWDGSGYKKLGSTIPNITVLFSLGTATNDNSIYTQKYVTLTGMLDGIIVHRSSNPLSVGIDYISGSVFKEGKYEDGKNALIGLLTMRLDEVKEAKRFAFPFWARYAIRLYDGRYTHISQPFLLFPTVRRNWDIFACRDDDGTPKVMDGDCGGWEAANYMPWYNSLKYQVVVPAGVNMNEWSDIIAGVDVFVSDEVKSFDMEGRWTIENTYIPTKDDPEQWSSLPNPLFDGHTLLADTCEPGYNERKHISAAQPNQESTWRTYYKPALLTDEEIARKLVDKSVFYKLFEIDRSDFGSAFTAQDAANKFEAGTLKALTSQTQLPNDDYFSRTTMKANVMKGYNSRLHLADVRRSFFNGFSTFSYTAGFMSRTFTYYVTIRASDGERVVSVSSPAPTREIPDVWFYYPDPRAKHVDIFAGGTKYVSLELKEHPRLNGAYAFGRLPDGAFPQSLSGSAPSPRTDDELMEDHIFVSEADNPWVFNAKGDVTTKMGAIIGLATQTMSLGELEHGIHPLSVFSERGISLLRLNDEGVYMRTDEIEREVANKSNPCIIETDGPVYFASERGLMVLAGNQVKCVSEQLNGKANGSYLCEVPFATFLKQAFIAYDYRDSLLWIFNTGSGFEETCWVYNIKSGTFSQFEFETDISNAVNDYPDFLLQDSRYNVLSLLNRKNINDDTGNYQATMTSRPMKLENALALKSIMQMRNIKDMEGTLTVTIKAANDLTGQWTTLTSLRGRPWKYYKMKYDFANLKATDRFAGTVIITQERRTNKLR